MARHNRNLKVRGKVDSLEVKDTIINIQNQFKKITPRVILILTKKYNMDRSKSEDAVQDTFLKLVMYAKDNKNVPVLKTENSDDFFSYVLRSSINNCISVVRREKVLERNHTILLNIVDEHVMQDERCHSQDRVRLLHRSIDELPNPYKSIFDMMLSDELSLAEIARKLNIKQGTIYTQFQRELEKLRYIVKKVS